MAIQNKFPWTNVSENTNANVGITNVGLKSNYSNYDRVNEAGTWLTCTATDLPSTEEIVNIKSARGMKRIAQFYAKASHVPTGVTVGSFNLTSQEVYNSSDAATGLDQDARILVKTSVIYDEEDQVTPEVLEEAIQRHWSLLYKADGTTRVSDLMRGSTTPMVD